jgi:D-amino-acid dehydrogenase
MRIVVLGSGVIGVTAAWFLARDGHEVVVVDRNKGPAEETSFANAGLVSPGHAQSWASPRAPAMLLRSLFDRDAAVRLRLRLDPKMWAWGVRFLANCTAARAQANTRRKLALCLYSLDALHKVIVETGVEYHRHTGGILYLHRSQQALDEGAASRLALADAGLETQVIDAVACVQREPALAHLKDRIAGAILCPQDESGDCNLFTRRLAERCAREGVEFRFATAIRRLVAEGGAINRVETDSGTLAGDAYVLALGCESPALARPLGIGLPIHPMKGYALTLPVRNGAPAGSGIDEERYLAWSRFGDRLRITSVAELAGFDRRIDPARVARMAAAARALFPDGADWDQPNAWVGFRPMTPDGLPFVGRTRLSNLWLDTGHSSLGWTMSCGSARLLADLVAGRRPAFDPALLAALPG